MHGYADNKQDHLRRLRRIEGQVRGLQRMVEEDEYCIDILTQVSAATKALQSVALALLDEHLAHCVVDAAARGRRRGRGQGQGSLRRDRPPRPLLTVTRPRATTNRHVRGAIIMTTTTYTVKGMTCGHCVSSVTEEVTEIPGVTGVEVDLATGR